MGPESVSTHTVKNDATTTIVTRTTTIVSEHEEILAEPKSPSLGVVENVKRTLRDYWHPNHDEDEDEDDSYDSDVWHDPSQLKNTSLIRRAYDYVRSLTQDADEAAKELVIEAKKARDEAAAEARFAFLGYKKEAREAYEAAEKKYRDALENAERVHKEAQEKAKSKWFQEIDKAEDEVSNLKDKAADVTHQKWDRFKAAVNSFIFNPPKYGCSPSSQYWFSSQPSTGWDCREVWDHPSRHDHRHLSIKTLPKKILPVDKVHDTLSDLWRQAASKTKSAPSVTSSFESSLKSVQDYYHSLLDRINRGEQGAIDELDMLSDKVKSALNEAKYYEEQTESWLSSQWNAVIDNAGESKDQYERALKRSLKNIKKARDETYNSFSNNLQKSLQNARTSVRDAYRTSKDRADKSKLNKAIKDANESFVSSIREAEAKLKAAPRNAYDEAIEAYNRETAYLKAKLEQAAKSASSISSQVSKSGSSLSHQASKTVSSVAGQASHDAKSLAGEARKSYQSATDKARDGFEQATASVSSMWDQATPYPANTLHKAQNQYHKLLGGVHSHWFNDQDRGEMNASSVYSALLAMYFLFMAHRLWRNRRLDRMPDPMETTITVVKNGEKSGLQNGDHAHASPTIIEKFTAKASAEDVLEKDRNMFGGVLTQFTAIVPVTLILLILLELGGFSRLALHSLFIGLVTSQLLQGGMLNGLLRKMGVIDGVRASGRDIGVYLSWGVLGLAALANTVKTLHG